MLRHLKFAYEAPNLIALNWVMPSQAKVCIAKSCEICPLLRYRAVYSTNSLLTTKTHKRDQSTT